MTPSIEEIAAEIAAEEKHVREGVVDVLSRGPNYSRGIVDALGLPLQRQGGASQRPIRLVQKALRDLEARGKARSWTELPDGCRMLRRYYELL